MKHSFVLNFLSRRPLINDLRVHIIKSWDFIDVPMISFMGRFHVLFHLNNKKDYPHAWAREGWVVADCQFKLFN